MEIIRCRPRAPPTAWRGKNGPQSSWSDAVCLNLSLFGACNRNHGDKPRNQIFFDIGGNSRVRAWSEYWFIGYAYLSRSTRFPWCWISDLILSITGYYAWLIFDLIHLKIALDFTLWIWSLNCFGDAQIECLARMYKQIRPGAGNQLESTNLWVRFGVMPVYDMGLWTLLW